MRKYGIPLILLGTFMMLPPTSAYMQAAGVFLFVGGGILYLKGDVNEDKDRG